MPLALVARLLSLVGGLRILRLLARSAGIRIQSVDDHPTRDGPEDQSAREHDRTHHAQATERVGYHVTHYQRPSTHYRSLTKSRRRTSGILNYVQAPRPGNPGEEGFLLSSSNSGAETVEEVGVAHLFQDRQTRFGLGLIACQLSPFG